MVRPFFFFPTELPARASARQYRVEHSLKRLPPFFGVAAASDIVQGQALRNFYGLCVISEINSAQERRTQ